MKSKYFAMFCMPIILLLLVSLMYMVGCSSPSNGADSGSSSNSTESTESDNSASSSEDGKDLYESKCSTCHSLTIIEDSGYTDDQWEGVVKDMQKKTTTISDSDAAAITQYLESTYK